MKINEYMPYNFDFKYEYLTYKNIGKEEEINYYAKICIFYRLYLGIRKLLNKNEKKYKNLNKFSEWEEYVKSKRVAYFQNEKNFLHFLKSRLRHCETVNNIMGNIILPISVLIFSVSFSVILLPFEEKAMSMFSYIYVLWIFFDIFLFLLLGFLINSTFKTRKLYFFLMDYIKIIEK